MKKEETLHYEIGKIGDDTITMSVRLHRTHGNLWDFFVDCDGNADDADRILIWLSNRKEFETLFDSTFNAITLRGEGPMRASGSVFYCYGENFPDRESVMKLINEVLLPTWKGCVGMVLECSSPGDSWHQAVWKAEKKYLHQR